MTTHSIYKSVLREVRENPQSKFLCAYLRIAAFDDLSRAFLRVYDNIETREEKVFLIKSLEAFFVINENDSFPLSVFLTNLFGDRIRSVGQYLPQSSITPEVIESMASIVRELYILRNTYGELENTISVYEALDVQIGLLSSKINKLVPLDELFDAEETTSTNYYVQITEPDKIFLVGPFTGVDAANSWVIDRDKTVGLRTNNWSIITSCTDNADYLIRIITPE